MLNCFVDSAEKVIPIVPLITSQFDAWLKQQNERINNIIRITRFKADAGTYCLLMNSEGQLEKVFLGIANEEDFFSFAVLPKVLPEGNFVIDDTLKKSTLSKAVLAFGLGSYQFTAYKKQLPLLAKLVLPSSVEKKLIENYVRAIFLIRDLVNTPTEDMGPAELAEAAVDLAKQFGADVKQIIGEDLVRENYPLIYAVGKASVNQPRLIDLRWGKHEHPKVTLVGKGVCFDTGGLDIKPADGMLLMKKDMAGAAHALGIAHMIMAMQLPVQLRVLIPAVENSVSGNAYRPGDIIMSRKGLSVEISNTDAEGRLVLADALAEAAAEKPQLLFDFATLTGAASIALGPEIPSLFTPDEKLAEDLLQSSIEEGDLIWRMPLYKGYRRYLDSPVADIMNASLNRYAGSIVAALFLHEFVLPEMSWAHFDFMAWNPDGKNGRMQGAEAMAMRTVFGYLQKRFAE